MKKEPEVRPEYLKKLEKIRKQKKIYIGTMEDFRKRYGMTKPNDKINLKPDYKKKLEKLSNQKGIKFNNVDELRKSLAISPEELKQFKKELAKYKGYSKKNITDDDLERVRKKAFRKLDQ